MDERAIFSEVERRFTEKYAGLPLSDALLAQVATELRAEGWPVVGLHTSPGEFGVKIHIHVEQPS